MTTGSEEMIGGRSALEGFAQAAKDYGVEGLDCHKEGDSDVLEQNVGEGWPGLGYDGQNLWMGLTPDAHLPNKTWNANSRLDEGKEYRGIVAGNDGVIDSNHPLARLYKDWQAKNPDSKFHITGEHAEWRQDDTTVLRTDEEGKLHGNIPVGKEVKAVITKVPAKWGDGNWVPGAQQRLEIKAPPAIQR